MNLSEILPLLCSLFISLKLSVSQHHRTHYIAGVVEFRPSSTNNVLDNLANYLEIIHSHEAESTDIIVFPEMTLSSNSDATYVPDTSTPLISPCDESTALYHQLLVELSCAAKSARKYVVVNVAEKVQCPDDPDDIRPCATNGLNVYNTNVVFNREGCIVSRYRKINLYGEPKNVTWQPQIGWFDTDFGVRFGHFICFDILFYMPAQELAEVWHIRDFIFTTMWFSQLPFLTAVQFQFAWAYGNNVNLLAAGASRPEVGNTGSGIYVGRSDPLVAVMKPSPGERRLLVAKVPIKPTAVMEPQRRFNSDNSPYTQSLSFNALNRVGNEEHLRLVKPFDMRMKRDYLELYDSELLDFSMSDRLSRELCNGNRTLCCNFELQWRSLNATKGSIYYTYRLGVFDGWRREDGAAENLLKNCALFACLDGNDAADIMQCGKLYEPDTNLLIEPQVTFEYILIETTLPRKQQQLLMPNSLLDTLMPLPVTDFSWDEEVSGDNHTVRYRMHKTVSNLLTFSIYGNYFNGSPNVSEIEKNDASVSPIPLILMFGGLIILSYIYDYYFSEMPYVIETY